MVRLLPLLVLLVPPALADLSSDLDALCASHSGVDLNSDGAAEVESLSLLPELVRESADAPLALVLVEERLLQMPTEGPDLLPHLGTYVDDLATEGWSAVCVGCSVYAGENHQDGLTLLALREFLRGVAASRPELEAVMLVGAFPDACIVRQVNWWKHEPITLHAGQEGERVYDAEGGIDFLRSYPESVCFRADIVLGDLDGHWEDLYHQEAVALPYLIAAYPDGRETSGFGPDATEQGELEFVDFFFVNDGEFRVHSGPNGRTIVSPLPSSHAECSADDLRLPNPVARPEVLIGRLDARHASVIPDPTIVDRHGRHFLSPDGVPQVMEFESEEEAPKPRAFYVPSEPTERRMLAEWFERRHGHSAGEYADQRFAASVGTGWGSAIPEVQAAFADLSDDPPDGYESVREDVTLLEAVEILKRPAVIRSMKAHGDPWGCTWSPAPDADALEAACGPSIWNWRHEGSILTPSVTDVDRLDFAITRSLYENGRLPSGGAVWLYTSCEGTLPAGAESVPYNHPAYGHWQGAECILFHLRGLALIGRSKVFYDEPREMWSVLGAGGAMGDVWRNYFQVDGNDAGLFTDNDIGRKRAYFWNVLGDPTVRVAAE